MMLDRVTLVAADCLNPEAALQAIAVSQDRCGFGDAILFTDRPIRTSIARVVAVPSFSSRADYSRFVLKDLADHVPSEFVLLVQWDGFVMDPGAWDERFLDYDYIGAPWWYQDGMNVGNGGFSLRSARLLRATRDAPLGRLDPEDEVVCRHYRPLLEARYGIRFAPEALARCFSFERVVPEHATFGFHGAFNAWRALEAPGLAAWLAVLKAPVLASADMLQLAYDAWQGGRSDLALAVLREIVSRVDDCEGARLMLADIGDTATDGTAR
jgi:hypothetical protein